jgi:Ca2+-binding EF-hand superfamily protein
MTTISSGVSSYTAGTGAMPHGGGSHRMQRGEGGPPGTRGPSLDELFSQIDTDGSGSISADELKTAMQANDASSSAGTSSSSDTATSANSLSGMGLNTQDFASMMGGGMRPPPPPSPMGGPGEPGGMPSLSSLDSDDDGSISKTEFGLSDEGSSTTTTEASSSSTEGIQELFKAIDGDGDGSLSSTEVNDFEKKLRALFDTMQQMGASTSSPSRSGATTASTSLSVMT